MRTPRQRAVITITEADDNKFNATLVFEPSIRNPKTKVLVPGIQDKSVCQAAWLLWRTLREHQGNRIIITDQ